MKRLAVLSLLLVVPDVMPGYCQEYYWTLTDSHLVYQSPNVLEIQFDAALEPQQLTDFASRTPSLSLETPPIQLDRRFYVFNVHPEYDTDSAASSIRGDSLVARCFPAYNLPSGQPAFYVTDVVNVKFHNEVLESSALDVIERHGLSFLDSSRYCHNLWHTALHDSLRCSPLSIANRLRADREVVWAAPSMHVRVIPLGTPLDEYYPNQFYLTNDGANGKVADADIDADSAWLFTLAGSAVRVAVLDIGVSPHPDLPANRLADGYDIADGDDDPTPFSGDPFFENHGMACAGILAATHNEVGIAGVNGSCLVIPVKIWTSSFPNLVADSLANAFYYAYEHGANVMSCSWKLLSQDANIEQAIYRVTRFPDSISIKDDRPDSGTVIVFGVGNDADIPDYDDGRVALTPSSGLAQPRSVSK